MISNLIFRFIHLFIFICWSLKYDSCVAQNATETPKAKKTQTPNLQFVQLTNMDYVKEGKNGSRYMNGKIAGFSNIAVSRCAEECFRKANCESINFNFDTMECELLTSGSDSAVVAEGWTYFKSIDWIQNISKSCKKDTCTGNAKCIDLSDGDHYCIVTHCDSPKEIIGAKSSSNVHDDYKVGKTIRYSCEPSARHTGNAEITCQNDGTWTGTSFECRCGDPPAVSGVSLGHERAVGTSFKYTCNGALVTYAGTRTTTCQSNGEWSSIYVYCECRSNPSTNSGTYFSTSSGRRIGDTWHLSCRDGYYSACSSCTTYTYCQSNGHWSHMDYYCIY